MSENRILRRLLTADEEQVRETLHPEDRGRKDLRNFSNLPKQYTSSHPTGPRLEVTGS
jgi:hypothetical protein